MIEEPVFKELGSKYGKQCADHIEMAGIAKLDKGQRYYHRTDEQLIGFANWKPKFETK